MSNLKYLNMQELKQAELECEKYIHKLSLSIGGQKERLRWIKGYIRHLEDSSKPVCVWKKIVQKEETAVVELKKESFWKRIFK